MGFSQKSINRACVVIAQYATVSRSLFDSSGEMDLFDELIAREYVVESGTSSGRWHLNDLGVKASVNYRPEFGSDARDGVEVGG